jgi:tetratricopeptide (TPR) repeat protein
MRGMKSLAFVLTLAVAACGGKNKNDPTTPGGGDGAGGQDPSGMGGGGPPGGGDVADGGDGGGGDTGGSPRVVPPDLDPDPAEAKAAVDMHLKVARQSLSGANPDPDGALKEAKLALGIDAASVDAAVVIVHAYYLKRLYDTAEVMLDELLKRPSAKNNAGLYYVYGLVYDKLNKKAEALLAYTKAVDLDGDHASARINLGVHQLANKAYDDAIENYEKVLRLGRDDAEIQNSLGSAYRGRSGDYDKASRERDSFLQKAETAYKRATTYDSNYAPAQYNLGLLFLDADPFPTSAGPMDTLDRLNRAKDYFDKYKNSPGMDIKLYDERLKDVDKQIKREEKRRKKAARDAASGDN